MMQATESECPLCMEQLEIDDVNFFPCTCGYQICRFCWHRIRTDENGLCPACRKPYSEDPAVYTPLSHEDIQRILKERKQKDVQRKQKVTENRKHLANVRVVQKNLVFVVGLTQRLADPELLKRPEYFSKFGKIHKIVVNNSTNYAGPQGPSASAYITYAREEDAIKAIIAVCNTHLDGRTLKASLGTTKYCSYFLRNIPCPKPDCMYLHELGDGAGSFTKEDMQSGKHQEYEQQLITFYSRKMEFSVDKGTREDWPAGGTSESAAATCLPTGAAWAGKGEDSEEGTKLPHHTQNKESATPVCNEDWEQNLVTPKHRFSTRAAQECSAQLPRSNTGWEKKENPSRGLERNPSLFPSDHYSGLGLSNLHLKVYGEDDLGFDPWNECSKGLADLLQEEEKTTKAGTASTNTQSYLSSFQRDGNDIRNWQDGLRALLPNINISFSESLASRQQGPWPSTTSYVSETRSSNWSVPAPQPQSSWQVRPPPGFEQKSPTNPMPMVDDPSILWSKTVDSEALQINKSIPRHFPNGFPGVHSLTRPTDLQGTAAASPKNKVMSQLTKESLQKGSRNTDVGVTSFEENREAYARGTDELLVKKGKHVVGDRCHTVTPLSGISALEQRTRVSELSVIQLDDPMYQPSQGIDHQQHNHLENRWEGGQYQETKKQQIKTSEEEKRGKDIGKCIKLQQFAPKCTGYDQQEQTGIVQRRKNSMGMLTSLQSTKQRKDYLNSTTSGRNKRFPDSYHQGNKAMHVASQTNSLQSLYHRLQAL